MTIFPFADQAGLGGEVRGASNDEILARFANVPLFDRKAGRGRDAVLDRSLLRPCGRGLDGRLRRPGARRRALGRRGRHGSAARFRQQLRTRLRLSGRPSLAVERAGPGPGGVGRPESGKARACSRSTTCCPRRCAASTPRICWTAPGTFTRRRRSVRVRAAGQLDAVDAAVRGVDQRAEPGRPAAPRALGHHSCRPHPDPPARPSAPPAADRAAGLVVCQLHPRRSRRTCARSRQLCPAGGSPSPARPPTPSRPSAARSRASRTARR